VDERIGMGFAFCASVQCGLACPAELALVLCVPCVLGSLEPDIACFTVEAASDGVFAIGKFRTIDRPSCHQAGQLRGPNTKDLLRQDIIHPFLKIRYLAFESTDKALRYFSQKDP